jgi:phosphoglycolate phosphatase-like HAD superfamily hydrolase
MHTVPIQRGVSALLTSRRRVLGSITTGAIAAIAAHGKESHATTRTGAVPGQDKLEDTVMRLQNDPLQSWNDGAAKQAIIDFVAAVSDEAGAQFVPEADRIATFDNDGTLWTEQPFYAQGFFVLDQIKTLAPQHPEWQTEQPYAALLSGDQEAIKQFGEEELGKLLAATHTGMTTSEFDVQARAWANSAKNPLTNHLFIESVYQPQLELLDYLRANGFQTFIVSGGGIDLMRTFAEEVYGIPPSQVVGSSAKVTYSLEDGTPTLTKQPELSSLDDNVGKPVNIHLHIGQKPILAFGNSDGDQQMLEYTDQGDGPRLMLIVHHDDAAREVAYDRDSKIGKLDTAWDEAVKRGWIVVSMKDDWGKIFPFEE